jgi:hypothetical protein
MKIAGIVLLIAGILMCLFTSINFTHEKNVVDLGPVQINKQEHKTLSWFVYAGIGIGLFGVALLAADKKGK